MIVSLLAKQEQCAYLSAYMMSRTMIGTVEVTGHFNEICELKTLFRRWVGDNSDNREVVVVVDLRQKVSPGTRAIV